MSHKKLRIHLFSKRGMYTVTNYTKHKIHLSTNSYGNDFTVPVHDFNEFGGGINYPDNDVAEKFLSVVNPNRFKMKIINEEKMKNNFIVNEIVDDLKESHQSNIRKLKKDIEKKWENHYEGAKNKAKLMEQLYRAALEEIEYNKNRNSESINIEFENNWEEYIKNLEYEKLNGLPWL